MKYKVKKLLLLILALVAVCCSALAVSAAAGNAQTAENGDSRYVLRDFDGYVAVFIENQPESPMTVTDIQVGTLREADRELLESGLKIGGHERLIMTLEDLCS